MALALGSGLLRKLWMRWLPFNNCTLDVKMAYGSLRQDSEHYLLLRTTKKSETYCMQFGSNPIGHWVRWATWFAIFHMLLQTNQEAGLNHSQAKSNSPSCDLEIAGNNQQHFQWKAYLQMLWNCFVEFANATLPCWCFSELLHAAFWK